MIPYNGASAITGYTITMMQSNGSFSPDLVNCDGRVPSIIAARTCIIPVSVLRAEPFNLEWGSSIWVKVSATNIIGDGQFSE
jgi:hypothetical protein